MYRDRGPWLKPRARVARIESVKKGKGKTNY